MQSEQNVCTIANTLYGVQVTTNASRMALSVLAAFCSWRRSCRRCRARSARLRSVDRAAMRASRRDAGLHAEHHRLGGLRQPAADQRPERRRPGGHLPGTPGVGRRGRAGAGGTPWLGGRTGSTHGRGVEVAERRRSSSYSHVTRLQFVDMADFISTLGLSRCNEPPSTFCSPLQERF